ncbi:AraC family transcriptional regulator [uncultured Muribaculum sp.]|uniref:helix-turn-helix domain-containing protein n=1 Tax=uncultured Muribaculum sp. TaxID=1918613 RepID=UPI0026E10B53|nr:helix-turn-helix domain-containing protein [uncultured Muribaculum sp.]
MVLKTIDSIPRSSALAVGIDNIAIFNDMSMIRGLELPAKIDFILSIMCEAGRLLISYDNRSHELTKNSLMVMRQGHVINSYELSPDFKGHVIVVSTKHLDKTVPTMTKFMPYMIHFMGNPVIKLTEEEMTNQIELRNLLKAKSQPQSDHAYRVNVVRSVLEALFFETLGVYSAHSMDLRSMQTIRRKDSLLYDFIQLVESEFRRERSVAYYANQLCVSPKHLSSMVKEASGRTAGDWIDSYVIMEAKALLKNTGMTVQEISQALNFANQSFFGKYFKHLTGISPRMYRSTLL